MASKKNLAEIKEICSELKSTILRILVSALHTHDPKTEEMSMIPNFALLDEMGISLATIEKIGSLKLNEIHELSLDLTPFLTVEIDEERLISALETV